MDTGTLELDYSHRFESHLSSNISRFWGVSGTLENSSRVVKLGTFGPRRRST